MVLAAFDHLDVVGAGELGVLAAGVVGGADQRGAQQRRAGLGHGLALAVGVAGLRGLGGQTGEGPELLAAPEPGRLAHGGDQGGRADLAEAGQRPGQGAVVDPVVDVLAFAGVTGELGLGGAQQPDLGGDLGGQVRERDRGVAGVEVDRRLRGGNPLAGPLGALVVVRRLGDHRAHPLRTGFDQGVGVGPPLEHRQVRDTEITAQRRHRQQLADQVLDPHLVLRRGLGEPVTRPHPPVQRGPLHPRQLQWLQAGRVEQRQPGQRVGVDPVGLGVPGQEPAQIRRLGRRHPVHHMAPAGEEHRDRQPRRAGRLHHHLQAGPCRGPDQGRESICSEVAGSNPALATKSSAGQARSQRPGLLLSGEGSQRRARRGVRFRVVGGVAP